MHVVFNVVAEQSSCFCKFYVLFGQRNMAVKVLKSKLFLITSPVLQLRLTRAKKKQEGFTQSMIDRLIMVRTV